MSCVEVAYEKLAHNRAPDLEEGKKNRQNQSADRAR